MSRPMQIISWFLAFLLALEVGSFAVGRFESEQPVQAAGYIQLLGRHDPLLFWSLRPGASDPTGRVRINAGGLRGPSVGAKEPNETRILSLGDSPTLAPRLPYGQCYSARLERKLERSGRGGPVRVVNAGVPAYTLFQGFQYLKYRGLDLEPDVVLVYFGVNDFLPVVNLTARAGIHDQNIDGLNDSELFRLRRRPTERLRDALRTNSNLYRGLTQARASASADEAAGRAALATDATESTDVEVRVPERDRARLLAEFQELCASHDITLVLVIPWYAEFDEHVPLLREFARTSGVPTVDLPALFVERAARNPHQFFSDPLHPTARGHELIATAIHATLADLDL